MSFLFPQFLFGLFALSIPIIVHLFNFRRAKKLYFSNVAFLDTVKQTNSSKLRIKHLLVLFCRLLFVTFLVLAFAQPFIPGKEQGLSNKEVYLYLDNSLSMSNQVSGEVTALDQAYNYVATISDLYPRDTRFKLLTNDFAPYSNNLKGKEEVQELATEISYSSISRSMEEVLGRLDINSTRSANAKDLYFVSDFQNSTFGQSPSQIDSINNYYLLPVQYPLVGNVFVDSVYLKDPFLVGDGENQLNVKLINTGLNSVDDLVVKFFVEDTQVATASVNIPGESSGELTFDLNLDINGNQRCRLSFEEFPVAFDNDYYFVLSRTERINILEIRSENSGNSINNVYGNEELFRFSSFDAANFDYGEVAKADLVIINEVERINESLIPVFNRYLSNEGHLFVIPSENFDSLSYSQFVPGILLTRSGREEQEALASINEKNPYFAGIFETVSDRFDMPEAVSRVSWKPTPNDLVNFRNGDPFLSRFSNYGTFYMAASPFKDDFTGFAKHALFVPIMYRAAVLAKTNVNRLGFSLDESVISLKLDSLSKNSIYTLNRGQEEFVPNQRIVGDQLILDLPKYTLSSGFYDLMDGAETKTTLAFNNYKSESRIEQITAEEELRPLFSGVSNLDIFKFDSAGDFSVAMKERYEGINLWKYALVLALIFLLAEVLLLRFL